MQGAGERNTQSHYGYVIVGSAFVIAAVIVGTVFTFGVFLDPLLADFGWGRGVLSGAWSLCFILSGFLGILAGRLSDRFGPRRVVLICNLFLGLGFAMMSRVHAIWQVYLFYGGLVAIGMSASIAPLQSTVVRWFPRRRGVMLGIFLMGLTSGVMIVPLVANWLIGMVAWRTAYLALGIGSFLVISLAALFLKRGGVAKDELACTADCVERRGGNLEKMNELSFREAFRTSQFWLISAFFFFQCFAMMIIMTHIVSHAINVGIASTTAVAILAVIGGISSVMVIPEGFLADRIGIRKTAIIITSVLVVAMAWLPVTGQKIWSLLLFAVMFGVAFGGLDVLLSLITSRIFGLIALGAIIGFVNFALQVGGAMGPFIAGIMFDLTGSYQTAFLTGAGAAVIALMIALFIRPFGENADCYERMTRKKESVTNGMKCSGELEKREGLPFDEYRSGVAVL